MPAGGRIKFAEAFRIGANFLKQPFHLTIETHAQFR
jgi:hypothetical protein